MDPNPPQEPASTPDAPDKEKMSQIRARRLQKLQNSTPTKTPISPETGVASASSTPQQKPSTPTSAEPSRATSGTSTPSEAANPFNQLGIQNASLPKKPINITSKENGSKREHSASRETTASAPPRKAAPPSEETIEEFEHRTLSNIFRITLDKERQTDISGHKLTLLSDLREELEGGNEPIRLSVANLDTAISEAGSKIPSKQPVLDYLLPCWKRVVRALRGLKGYANSKDGILKEARRLCMSYCIFATTVPELFGREQPDSLTPYLLVDPDNERGICHDFLTEAVGRFDEDDSAKIMFTKAVAGMSLQLSSKTMNDNYQPYVFGLKNLTRFSPIVNAIAEDPLFQMATSAPGIEKHSLLGPFFRISPLQPEVAKTYFVGPKTMDLGAVKNAQNALRLTVTQHQKDLLDIINQFVRASTTSRNRTLDWFAYIVNSNHKRRAMRVDEKQVSSEGFMINVTVVLDGLCEPFMDATFSKVSKIDIDYLRRKPRVDIKDETKMNADQASSDKFYATEVGGTSNFISEVFFLTLAAHHYGTEASNSKLKGLDKDIKHLQKQLEIFERERVKIPQHQQPMLALQIKRYNDVLEKSMALKFAIEGVLFDDLMQARSLLFMRYVIVWMLRIATGSEWSPGKSMQLPLSQEQPDQFRFLPEYVLENIISNFKFLFRYIPHVITSLQSDELIALCITFLTSSEYIKNPGLKSGLVTLLFSGTWPSYHRSKGVLGDALIGDKFANQHLLHAVMKFYIECENTGSHTQFYDKFNIRLEIFQIIKCIWTNGYYRQQLMRESKVNTDFFVRFVNLLLNDATYVLDEALSKFPKIHALQVELARKPQNLAALSQEDQAAWTAKEEELASTEGQAKSYMQLTNETIAMMNLFTSALSDAFTMPEIVTRLADMMDYNLNTLVGEKSTNLKVDNKEKYLFNPRTLLSEFVDIYLNLGDSVNFIEAVARDGRSYRPSNFDTASQILERYSLKSREELAKWQTLKEKFARAKELDDQAEEDLGEVPDDFLDPLMYTLMEDPVILPTSRITIDRSTIRSHLLSDPNDPFNRQPMKIEDVVEDTEMREKIAAFKAERKAVARAAVESKMDTTEG